MLVQNGDSACAGCSTMHDDKTTVHARRHGLEPRLEEGKVHFILAASEDLVGH